MLMTKIFCFISLIPFLFLSSTSHLLLNKIRTIDSTWSPEQINLGRGISQYLDLNIIPRGSGRVPSSAVQSHLPLQGNELFNSATSLWSAWIQCHTRWKWKIKVSLNRETQFTVIIHVCRIHMKKTPREIKNPINSLTGEQLERPHTITKHLFWSPPFCIPKMATASWKSVQSHGKPKRRMRGNGNVSTAKPHTSHYC